MKINRRNMFIVFFVFVILVVTLFFYRVPEYFNLIFSSIKIENRSAEKRLSVLLLTPRKGGASVLNKQGYFDTLEIYSNGQFKTKNIPDVYGENEFIIGFGGQFEKLSCGIFKYRKWHKYKIEFSISDNADSYLVKWSLKSNFKTTSGVDSFEKKIN